MPLRPVQSPGLGPDILFGAPFFTQLAADLKANATLLAALKAEVAPLVQDNNPCEPCCKTLCLMLQPWSCGHRPAALTAAACAQ